CLTMAPMPGHGMCCWPGWRLKPRPMPERVSCLFSFLSRYAPWPSEALTSPLNPARARLEHWAQAGLVVPGIRLAWALCCLEPEEALARLALAARAARWLWVADFRAAERNLDWPAVQTFRFLTAGRTSSFLQQGGLEGCAWRAGLTASRRRPFWGGAALLLTFEASPPG
ncbi:MAG: hypothetical protein Q4F27_07135, partial [Desulfovibrionaceae bacterium]|nr:hypothetical protein [Desulfovibrionaceae bacterium]